MLLVGLCDSGKTLIFSRVRPYNCNVLYTATLSSRGCLADARLMCVCEWSPISCLGSCCQESTNGHRPPSLTAALHTKPKMTRWVKFIISYHPFMMIMVYRFPLSFLHSGHHLDSDRPARTWQPSLTVPWEVQICSQVRTCHVKSQVTWLIRPDHTLFSSSTPLTHISRAIVFVVDSGIFQKEVRDVAEFLYMLLTDTVISRNAPALLVACNKQGSTTRLLRKLPRFLPCVHCFH